MSDHFVIYGDQSEKAMKEFAERLERFHAAMVHVYKKEQTKPSPSNRVTIFVVSSAAEVRQVTGTENRYLSGIYIPRAGSSIAVIPKLKGASKYDPPKSKPGWEEANDHRGFARSGVAPRRSRTT